MRNVNKELEKELDEFHEGFILTMRNVNLCSEIILVIGNSVLY